MRRRLAYILISITAMGAYAAIAPIGNLDPSVNAAVAAAEAANDANGAAPPAAAPDSNAASSAVNTSAMSVTERLARLENQTQYLTTQNDQLTTLSSQLSDLRGQVQELRHTLQQHDEVLSLLQQRVVELEASDSEVSPEDLPSSSANQKPNLSALNDYNKAYTLINQGRYQEASDALNNYIQKNPKGAYIDKAYYWLGEINMLNGNADVAAKNFRVVISAYPSSSKAPDAMQQLGSIFLANGDSQHAKEMFEAVIQKYPHTGAAVLAQKTLKSMH